MAISNKIMCEAILKKLGLEGETTLYDLSNHSRSKTYEQQPIEMADMS